MSFQRYWRHLLKVSLQAFIHQNNDACRLVHILEHQRNINWWIGRKMKYRDRLTNDCKIQRIHPFQSPAVTLLLFLLFPWVWISVLLTTWSARAGILVSSVSKIHGKTFRKLGKTFRNIVSLKRQISLILSPLL